MSNAECSFPKLGEFLELLMNRLTSSKNYSEPHSQNRLFKAHLLLMWLPRHINL